MKRYAVAGLLMGWICLAIAASAETLLSKAQTETLLRDLTETPREQWIPAGTLIARHLEYRSADDYFAQSTETVSFDGNRFRWEIIMDEEEVGRDTTSINDNLKSRGIPDKAVNQRRLFCWDGQQYTRYYPGAGFAIVSGQNDSLPFEQPGPLSAAIIPWGNGDFERTELLDQNAQASEILHEGQPCIRIQFLNKKVTPALENTLILDPQKNHAVLSFTMENEAARMVNTYSGHTLHGDCWIPTMIRSERLIKTSGTTELISYEDWKFIQISTEIPEDSRFRIRLKNGTLVESHQPGGRKSFLYHASDLTNVSDLLEEKKAIGSSVEDLSQNCATAAVRHLVKRFSRVIQKDKLAALASSESGLTTLYDLKQNLEEAGLYCMAVQTDINALKTLPADCAAIVHLPGFRHYLILDQIDRDSVWTIDLNSRRFYWKQDLADFVRDWGEGIALLVSDQPTKLPIQMQTLNPQLLHHIQGGDYGTYSCSELIQYPTQQTCPQPVGGFLCGGAHYIFFERWGCREDEQGGTCIGTGMSGYMISNCINDPYHQGWCSTTNDRIVLMRACK